MRLSFFFISSIDFQWYKVKFLIWGVGIFLLLNFYTTIPKRLYIFFHELSHAIAAVFFSAKIFEFKVTKEEGYIKSDKSNIVIRLSPYFLPLASYIILLIHFATLIYFRHYYNYDGTYPLTFFLVGFFFTTTCYYNIRLILQETSDINREQLILSFLLIFNFFFLTSSVLFFLLFSSETVIDKFYFVPTSIE